METTDTVRASYLDLHLEIDIDWRFRMKLNGRREDCNFRIWKLYLHVYC